MSPSSHISPWWSPDRHADRRPFLIARNAVRRVIRQWFEDNDFIEVEPACLQVSPGNEVHVHAFETQRISTDLSVQRRFLHTSPEFAMKKLVAAGETRIFALSPVFRNREHGPRHANEFTMLEWYRAETPYEQLFDDCAALVKVATVAAEECGFSQPPFVRMPPARMTVGEAFAKFAGFPLNKAERLNRDGFALAARTAGLHIADDDTWTDIFSRVLTERIEPNLGRTQPTILYAYPIEEAALARPLANDASLAERFELYVNGVEIANGFGELTDGNEQRRRFTAAMHEKDRRYGMRHPIDDDFLAAVDAMPPTSGCALGFDRLVMAVTGATRIEQVLWTPDETS